jgi:hypothetical protein
MMREIQKIQMFETDPESFSQQSSLRIVEKVKGSRQMGHLESDMTTVLLYNVHQDDGTMGQKPQKVG